MLSAGELKSSMAGSGLIFGGFAISMSASLIESFCAFACCRIFRSLYPEYKGVGDEKLMRVILRLASAVFSVLAIATSFALPAFAAETCPFISDQQLRAAMPALKWSLISNQDGRGCIYQGGQADTMMLT